MSSRNNYYSFRHAKCVIAHELEKNGWKLYGYKEDKSDSMTDYFDPEDWDGIATKNGYIVVIDCSDFFAKSYSGKKDYRLSSDGRKISMNERDLRVVENLRQMTIENGCSESEAETAKEKIRKIEEKYTGKETYKIDVFYPVFQGNPPKTSWHVEYNGNIIIKGNGITKFADLDLKSRQNDDVADLWKKLDVFINRINSAAGASIGGNGKKYKYVTETVVKYRHKNVAVKVKPYKLENGTTFIFNRYMSNGINMNDVFIVHEWTTNTSKTEPIYCGVRLTNDLKRERNVEAKGNFFGTFTRDKFIKYLKMGFISMCKIQDEAEPYTEKVTRKVKVD